MPTYSYECKKCAHVTAVFHGISATPTVKCSECGGATRRLLGSGAGLIFKGSGFYETDYKRNGSNGSNGAGKSGGSSTAGSESRSEGKSEGKAASSSTGGSSSE